MEGFVNLAWLLPIPPFLAFLAIVLFLNRNKTVSALTAIGGSAVSWLLGWPIAFSVFANHDYGAHPASGELFTIPTGATDLIIGWQVDPANALMIFMATFVMLMIFIYSSGYMTFPGHLLPEKYPFAFAQGKDPRYSRFMAYISLFATGMLGLLVSNSLVMFFIFWEVMGLCSYLLIGFWYEKPSAKAAALKAFITTRIGDVIMFMGMMFLYVHSDPSSLVFSEVLTSENLHHLSEISARVPFLNLTVPWIAIIGFLIFFGTVGKSAQFPLHVWLPDAMEGPTPVSAMIHAATMVSAGVFLLIRMFPLFSVAGEVSPGLATFMAFIGAFTALFASTIAITQWDIKRVLAYSTISQLGYMVAVIAMGGYIAGLFHLVAHAFFKGLLFLGSGSVIHGMEHGMHHAHEHGEGDEHEHGPLLIDRPDGVLNVDDPQDMRNMGGLIHRGRMPWTAWTFTIGGMALAGLPILTTGFWSKDEILAYLYGTNKLWVFWVLAAAALLTAFYTARMITLSFTGAPRTEGAAHAPESVKSMVVPLVLLTPFAIGLGWIGIPNDFPLFGGFIPYWLEQYLEPHIEYMELHLAHPEFSYIPLAVSLVVALGGLLAGYFVYRGFEAGQVDPLRKLLGPIWTLMYRKYYVDEFYNATVVAFTRGLSKFLYWVDDVWVIDPIVNFIGRLNVWWSWVLAAFDRLVVDGTVNGAGWVADRSGRVLRNIQDGHVQVYLLVALVALTIWLLLEALPILLTLV